jgi:excisionase family DNA binding protein
VEQKLPNPLSFMSIDEAAKEIGCSRRFLEMRIEDGEIKVFRPSSRMVRIQRRELDRWIESFSCKRKY